MPNINAADFYDLASGRKRGMLPALMRTGLAAASFGYRQAVLVRNKLYDHHPALVHQVAVPVVSIGNLTVGGTGKTPMVKWIARRLRERGVRVALVSRGYGAEQGARNDEALELEQALPDVPHLQNPDRVAAAQTAIEELESQLILLDDGFQHRRLGRDLDIVLLDATCPFGFDWLLPRGTLREPIAGLRRAQVVCLTRSDRIDAEQRAEIRQRVSQIAPAALWCEATHQPTKLIDSVGNESPLDSFRGRKVAGFCAIGNPQAFRATIESLGGNVVSWQEMPDHHNFTAEDIQQLEQQVRSAKADLAVCTHKDLVKIQIETLASVPLRAVVVEMQVTEGERLLEQQLESLQIDRGVG